MPISVILSLRAIPPVVSISIMANFWLIKVILFQLFILSFYTYSNVGTNAGSLRGGNKILSGAERLELYTSQLKGKRIGVVANHSSIIGNTHLVDTLLSLGVDVRVIFSPEHGYQGRAEAGAKIGDEVDKRNKISIISLYGLRKKPKPEDLINLDIILFDLQDVGVRFYTYISTLHYIMEAAAEQHIELIVLDRPNPNGHYIDGPVLDSNFSSFVGLHKIPVVYGMTIGELSKMIKGECWISKCGQLNLTVIPCKLYNRNKLMHLNIPPSPNLKTTRSILLYPSLCFFEGTSVSVGRGTDSPFEIYGHPKLTGSFNFVPREMESALNPPWKDVLCKGFDLRACKIKMLFSQKALNLSYIIRAYQNIKADEFFLKNNFIDKLAGTDELRKQILAGKSEVEIRKSWSSEILKFKRLRKKYLIYEDIN